MGAPWRWFARTFGIAVVAHLAGNPPVYRDPTAQWLTPLVAVSAVLGLLAVLLVVAAQPVVLGADRRAVLVSVWCEASFLSNHWLLVGFVAAAVLVSLGQARPLGVVLGDRPLASCSGSTASRPSPSSTPGSSTPPSRAGCSTPTSRSGRSGCRRPDRQSGRLAADPRAGADRAVRPPPAGVRPDPAHRGPGRPRLPHRHLLGPRPALLRLHRGLVMLLCLFLPESTLADLEARAARRTKGFVAGVAICVLVVLPSVLPQVVLTDAILDLGAVRGLGALRLLADRDGARGGLGPSPLPMRLPGAAAWVLVAVVVANGLTPYLELKTAYGFNMYANLVTVAGESNHFVVRDTLPLTDVQDHLLSVVETEDRRAAALRRRGLPHPRAQSPGLPGSPPRRVVVVTSATRERRAHPRRQRRGTPAPARLQAPAVPGRGHPRPATLPGRTGCRHADGRWHTGRVNERLVFDGDCGFCTTSADWLARGGRVEIVPWQFLDLATVGLTIEQVSTSVWWLVDDRPVEHSSRAIGRALLGRGRPGPGPAGCCSCPSCDRSPTRSTGSSRATATGCRAAPPPAGCR